MELLGSQAQERWGEKLPSDEYWNNRSRQWESVHAESGWSYSDLYRRRKPAPPESIHFL